MAQLRFHRPHAVDGALGDAHRHAALEHDEGRADARNGGLGRVGNQLTGAHKIVFQVQRPGARAFHGRKARAVAHRHARCVAAQQKHQFAAQALAFGFHRRNGAAAVVGPEVAHPGQRAVHPVAAVHRRGLEQQALNLRVALHGVGQRGAAQPLPAGHLHQRVARERWVARLFQVQPAHRLAPHHEAGGAAHARSLGHGADGQAVVAQASGRGQVRAHGAGAGQLLQHRARVVALAVNALHLLGQRALGNGAHGGQQAVFGRGGEFGWQVSGVHGGSRVRRCIHSLSRSRERAGVRVQSMEISNGIGLRMLLATGE